MPALLQKCRGWACLHPGTAAIPQHAQWCREDRGCQGGHSHRQAWEPQASALGRSQPRPRGPPRARDWAWHNVQSHRDVHPPQAWPAASSSTKCAKLHPRRRRKEIYLPHPHLLTQLWDGPRDPELSRPSEKCHSVSSRTYIRWKRCVCKEGGGREPARGLTRSLVCCSSHGQIR